MGVRGRRESAFNCRLGGSRTSSGRQRVRRGGPCPIQWNAGCEVAATGKLALQVSPCRSWSRVCGSNQSPCIEVACETRASVRRLQASASAPQQTPHWRARLFMGTSPGHSTPGQNRKSSRRTNGRPAPRITSTRALIGPATEMPSTVCMLEY